MNISRRSFLKSMLAAAAAPAIVRASSLMTIVVPKQEIVLASLEDIVDLGLVPVNNNGLAGLLWYCRYHAYEFVPAVEYDAAFKAREAHIALR